MSLADEIMREKQRVVDQTAETQKELRQNTGWGKTAIQDFANKKVNSGEWEKVFKLVEGRLVPAYRRVAKHEVNKDHRKRVRHGRGNDTSPELEKGGRG